MASGGHIPSLAALAKTLPPLSQAGVATGKPPALAPRRFSGRFRSVGEVDANGQSILADRHWTVHVDIDGDEPGQCLSITGHFPGGATTHLLFDVDTLGGKAGEIAVGGPIRVAFGATALLTAEQCLLRLPDSNSAPTTGYHLHLVTNNAVTHGLLLERIDGFFRDLAIEIDNLLVPEPPIHSPVLTSIDPLAHPIHPADLPPGTVTIAGAFGHAGLRTKVKGPAKAVAAPEIGPDELWDESELHAAMLSHWAANPGGAGWRLWHGLVSTSVFGTDYQGLMFDVHDELQRQGSVTFLRSLLSSPPLSELGKPALQQLSEARRTFWCMVHEMGHGLNLAHSFEKEKGTAWLPIASDSEARSFMNYPRNVDGGEEAFFSDFRYLFSADERLFLRHAPEEFVVPGGSVSESNHAALTAPPTSPSAGECTLSISATKASLSPFQPLWLDAVAHGPGPAARIDNGDLTIALRCDGGPWQHWHPAFHLCDAIGTSGGIPRPALRERRWRVPLSLSRQGWMTGRPGQYEVRARWGDRATASLHFTVRPPASPAERQIGQSWSEAQASRLMAFGGCPQMPRAEALLLKLVETLPDHPAALHAALAIIAPRVRRFKQLTYRGTTPQIGLLRSSATDRLDLAPARQLLARRGLTDGKVAAALSGRPNLSIAARLSRLAEQVGG